MESVPKIVVKRLNSPATESHPDADLLTAFAEHSLTGAERGRVVDHLARCGDCREVVSLALPPQVEAQTLAEGSVNWFRWTLLRGSAWRWAAVAAGMVLVASIGTLQYRNRYGRDLASNVIETKPAITAREQSPEPAHMTAPQAAMQSDKLAAPHTQTALAENKPGLSKVTVVRPRPNSAVAIGGAIASFGNGSGAGRSSSHGSAFAGAPPNSTSAAAALQNPAPAPAQQTVEVSGASPVVEVQTETAQITTQPVPQNQIQDQLIPNEPAEQSQASADRVGKAKAASAQASPSVSLAAPRWTISASGLVQRSLDGGKTWLDVNVATDDSAPDRRVRAQMVTIEVQADSTSEERSETRPEVKKQAKSKNNEKQSAPAAPVVFRALCVSTNATEVWAGGSGGALYHTVDAGNRWSRVVPSAAGIFLTGDILSIQFADPRSGTVTTSKAEVWTTLDDGQTWQRQP